MRRAFVERQRTLRIWRAHNQLVHAGMETHCPCDKQPGRFRKGQRVGGCNRPRCWVCHSGKLAKQPSLRDERLALSYQDWLVEHGYSIVRGRRQVRISSYEKIPKLEVGIEKSMTR